MGKLSWTFKDPNEILDYTINWYNKLGTDTISSSSWANITTGITLVTSTNSTTTTTIWLSGGTSGHSYNFSNRVVTSGGRTMDQSVRIEVWDK